MCGKDTTLMALLAEFKRRPHLAVVAEGEAASRHVGDVALFDRFYASI